MTSSGASAGVVKQWLQEGKKWRRIKLVSDEGYEKVYDEFQLGSGKWRKFTARNTLDKKAIILAVKQEYQNFVDEGVTKLQIRNMHYKMMEHPELNLGQIADPYQSLDKIITEAREHGVQAEPGEPEDKYWIPDEWWQDLKRRTPDPRPFRTPDQHAQWIMEYHVEGWVDHYPSPIWYDQNKYYIEIWCEKDTMVSLLEQLVTKVFGVKNAIPVVSSSGFTSRSHSLKQINRLLKHQELGRKVIIFYLGDYDPSGLTITDDHKHRLQESGLTNFEIKRIGVTLEQIQRLGLKEVTDPAKIKALHNDNNGRAFEEMPGHGGRRFCVEVDSMSSGPGLRELKIILRSIKEKLWGQKTWKKYKDAFTADKVQMRLIARFVPYARELIDRSDNPNQTIEEYAQSLQSETDEINEIDGGHQPVEEWDQYDGDDDDE
jgi:hypothetical protein